MMKFIPNRQTLKSAGTYLGIGAAVFVLGLVWNFPYERLKTMLTSRLTRQTGYQFDVDTLSPALPLGFEAKGARILSSPGSGQNLDYKLESLRVTVSPFSLLLYPFRKSVSLSYTVRQNQNKWTGGVGIGRDSFSLEWNAKNVKLKESFPMAGINPMLAGSDLKLSGTVSLSGNVSGAMAALTRSDFSAADGEFSLSATNAVIEAPIVKTLEFDKITLNAALEKGMMTIKTIDLTGPSVGAKASGSLKLEPFYARSQLSLDTKLTISEKATELRSLVSLFAGNAGLKMDDTGTIAMKITGSLLPLENLSVRGY